MVRLAIAGGNIAGSTVMSMLRGDLDIEIVGMYEKDPETPGAVLAQKWGILFYDVNILPRKSDQINNVTGDTTLSSAGRTVRPHRDIDATGHGLCGRRSETEEGDDRAFQGHGGPEEDLHCRDCGISKTLRIYQLRP
jgi:hypothetical protein